MSMGYVLTGVSNSKNIRLFVFDRANADRTHTEFTVAVDISLIRTYAISLQELPLLCHDFLETRAGAGLAPKLIFGEAEMVAYTYRRAATKQAEDQRKARRKAHLNRGE
jgi:hypothetical protein